jgi:hypothetical protein
LGRALMASETSLMVRSLVSLSFIIWETLVGTLVQQVDCASAVPGARAFEV